MINYFDALKRAKGDDQSQKVIDAWDFGKFWLFSLGPDNFPDNQIYASGTIFTSVMKETGKVGLYDITSDPEAYFNAKHVEDG